MLSSNIPTTTNSNELTQVDISQMSAYDLYAIIKEMYINSIEGFNFHDLKIVKLEYHNKQMIKKNDRIDKLERQNKALKSEIEELKKQLNEYKKLYGEYISPFEILEKLYKNNKYKEYYSDLAILNPKSSLPFNIKAIEHWLNVFQDLQIIEMVDKGRYIALVNYKNANKILKDFVVKNKEI